MKHKFTKEQQEAFGMLKDCLDPYWHIKYVTSGWLDSDYSCAFVVFSKTEYKADVVYTLKLEVNERGDIEFSKTHHILVLDNKCVDYNEVRTLFAPISLDGVYTTLQEIFG